MEITEYEYDYRATLALDLAIEVLAEIIYKPTTMRSRHTAKAALQRILEIVPEFDASRMARGRGP